LNLCTVVVRYSAILNSSLHFFPALERLGEGQHKAWIFISYEMQNLSKSQNY